MTLKNFWVENKIQLIGFILVELEVFTRKEKTKKFTCLFLFNFISMYIFVFIYQIKESFFDLDT